MTEFQQYALHGWFLCDISRGRKSPMYEGWNDPEKIKEVTSAAEGLDGAGICHVESPDLCRRYRQYDASSRVACGARC